MTSKKKFEKGMWQGSRDRDNSVVQTAAMGQIPRSAERILVEIGPMHLKYVQHRVPEKSKPINFCSNYVKS